MLSLSVPSAFVHGITRRYTHNAIEQCRQACGGHGYSKYNALASMAADFAVMCTWEGDNVVRIPAEATSAYSRWHGFVVLHLQLLHVS